jgi:mRNA interferase HigB
VRIISRQAILRFAERHRDALASLMNWYRITKRADWSSLVELRRDFAHADAVGRRTVFNIHKYRLIARVNYRAKRTFILHILTYAEYSKGGWNR